MTFNTLTISKADLIISEKEYDKAYTKMRKKIVDEWFDGDKNSFDEWAGDVLYDVATYFINELGIRVDEEE